MNTKGCLSKAIDDTHSSIGILVGTEIDQQTNAVCVTVQNSKHQSRPSILGAEVVKAQIESKHEKEQ
jgi:hypothetical protein